MITYTNDLDMVPGGIPTIIHLSQYDQDFSLVFNLYARDGSFSVSSGTSVSIRGTKADGNGYSVNASISGTTVTVTGDQQMTAAAGRQYFELTLKYNNKELNSANFVLEVERAALDKDTLVSGSVIKELVNVIDRTDEIISAARQADSAVANAQTILDGAKAAKDAAESSAAEASSSARTAGQRASAAETSATEAEEAARLATLRSSSAANSASVATQKAAEAASASSEATEAASRAFSRASEALASANEAKTARDEAVAARTRAETASMDASSSAMAAAASENAAKAKELEILQINAATDALSTQALTVANNAENEVAELSNQIDGVSRDIEQIRLSSEGYVDNGYVENGVAYFEHNGTVLFEITGIGGSGGSGGGGDTNAAILSVTNTSGFLSKTIADGGDCPVSLLWSSTEDEMPTGNGSLRITVNGSVRATMEIEQGNVNVDIAPYCGIGSNVVKVQVSDVYGNARTINYSITVVALSISSTFDTSTPYSGAFAFPYTPVGAVSKTVYFVLDGREIGTQSTSVSGRQMSYTIPAQVHGAHSLRCYFEAEVNNETVRSNELYFEYISIATGNDTVIITSNFTQSTASQYESVFIPYRVYDPKSNTAEINLYLNDTLVSTQTVDRTEQSFAFRANDAGQVTFKVEAGNVSKTFTLNVTESDIDVEAEKQDLVLYLNAQGRSNNEDTKGAWEYGNIAANLQNFGWRIDGWLSDEDGVDVLRLEGDARVTIPYKLFGTDFKATGKTIEIEFATRDVSDFTATILSCYADGVGLQITPQNVLFKGAQNEISTLFKDNEHIRLSIVIEKQNENRLILVYINGIMSRAIQYASGERFSQLTPVDISIGSSDCGMDIYCIRVYDNDLNREQVLANWIADTQNGATMLERYTHNNVYDEYGQITTANLPKDLPYMILEAAELPQYKGDKKIISGSYTDPVYPTKSFSFSGAQANVQGTSSAPYYRKNYDLQLLDGIITSSGGKAANYALRAGSIPFNRFVLKADVASSESTNNTGLVMFYNDTCPYKKPSQVEDSRVRWGIEGVPIVVFWHNPDDQTTTFLGKYNFNLPKRAPEPYGYTGNMESWEWERNNSANVKFQDDDFVSQSWDELEQNYYPTWYDDFEARFPSDEWRDYSKLKELLSWVKSTWRNEATNENLASPVVYRLNTTSTINDYANDTSYTVTDEKDDSGANTGYKIFTFTKDTPAFRLTKFKAELPDYVEVDSAVFYYLFTELFLMIDSRAKNMFIGFSGSSVNDAGRAMDRKAVFEPYDMDTAIGTNNSGVLMFGYYLEDTDTVSSIISGGSGGSDAPVFNAQDSVFWTNLRDSCRSEIAAMYRSLRSSAWSYRAVETMYEEHQSKWPEAIFNEDAYTKYLIPLIDPVTVDESTGQLIKTDRYLTMLQGSKTEQRKWWLYNRFRYLDSKFSTGDASANRIAMRLFNSGTLTVTPAIDLYVAVYFGGGTTASIQRTTANKPVSFSYEQGASVQEMETWIDSADLITDVGDLSAFYPNELDFSRATKLKRLQIGSGKDDYSNSHLVTVDVRNSGLLEYIDLRNCPNLAITVNLEGSPRLKEAYFDNTAVTGVDLADGCTIEHLHLPGTITTLTLFNLNNLKDFVCPSFANVSRLMLANIDTSIVDPLGILNSIHANSQVYIEGMRLEAADAAAIEGFLDLLDTMVGVSRERNAAGEWIYHDHDAAQVSGSVHTEALTGSQIAAYNERYPYITVTADHTTSYLYYYTYDGATLLYTETIQDGGDGGAYTGKPTRAATAANTYTFAGWSRYTNQTTADPNALNGVTADRKVYAAYTVQGQVYTVTFKNNNGAILQTVNNVPYGGTATYTGATPTYVGTDAAYYTFNGWSPAPTNIQGNTTCTAQYLDNRSVVIKYLMRTLTEYDGDVAKIGGYAFYNA